MALEAHAVTMSAFSKSISVSSGVAPVVWATRIKTFTSSSTGYFLISSTIGEGSIVMAMFLYPISKASFKPSSWSNSAVSGFSTVLPLASRFSITSGIGVVLTRPDTLAPTP